MTMPGTVIHADPINAVQTLIDDKKALEQRNQELEKEAVVMRAAIQKAADDMKMFEPFRFLFEAKKNAFQLFLRDSIVIKSLIKRAMELHGQDANVDADSNERAKRAHRIIDGLVEEMVAYCCGAQWPHVKARFKLSKRH